MRATTETITGFLRNHRKVIATVEKKGQVVLRQTGGRPSLRLTLERRAAATSGGGEEAASLLAATVASSPDAISALTRAMIERHPWARLLPEEEQRAFAREFVDTLSACVALDKVDLGKLDEVVYSWRSTAEIYAEPGLADELCRPLPGSTRRVKRP